MLNNKKTQETNLGKIKNRICLRQSYQIKKWPKHICNTFENGPDTVQYTSLKKKITGGNRK